MIFMKKYIIEFRMLSILHYCVQRTFIVFFFSETEQPATYPTPYPDTTKSYPRQPYPYNGGAAPYPTDGTNPATMGIAQPPPYESKATYDNRGLVK